MAKFKVYITDYDYPDNSIEAEILEPIGAEVIGLQCKDGQGIATQAKDADALMVQYAKVFQPTIQALPNLKVIARYGIGVDIVDIVYASERGIICTNVADYCIDEVADHNITLLLMLLRRIPMFVQETKKGKWHWSETGINVQRFTDTTIGIIGFGRIAQNMAGKLKALGFNLITYDPFFNKEAGTDLGIEYRGMNELLSDADAVCLQCPYTPENHHIIGRRELEMMKPHGILINCSRGKLVDNKALYTALATGVIASAALDDPEEEPAKMFNWSPNKNPLFGLNNCFITPHVAYYSEGSLIEARRTAAENVKAVLLGQTPPNQVHIEAHQEKTL